MGWLSILGSVLGLGLLEVGNHRLEARWGRLVDEAEDQAGSILGYKGVSSTYVSMQMYTISTLPLYLLRSRRGIHRSEADFGYSLVDTSLAYHGT